MSKVCVFVAQGLEEGEALVPADLLRRAGEEVVLAAVGGQRQIAGSHHITFLADALAEEVELDDFAMIVLPGGMPGTKNLEASETVQRAVRRFAAGGKWVAALCAAPTVLGHLGVLQGRRATCYPGCEDELQGAQVTLQEVVRDGKFITSRGLGTALPFGLALVAALQGEEKARALGKKVVWMHEALPY